MAPPIKGGVRVTVRVRRQEHFDHYRREAQRRGVTLSDYLADRLAEAHNFTIDDGAPPPQFPLRGSWHRDNLALTARIQGLIEFWEHHPEIRDEVRQRAMRILDQEEDRHDVA